MKIDSEELEEYVKSALTAVNKAVRDAGSFQVDGPIKFRVAVTNVKEGGGGIKIYVVDAQGKATTEQSTQIEFEVKPTTTSKEPVRWKRRDRK